MADYDLAIIGGGINGAGIARDAAGRGPARAAARAERPRLGHLVGLDQADPRRPALSRARRVPAGARGADRARGAAAHRAAHHPADALRAAGDRRACARRCMLRLGLFLYDWLGGRKILPRDRDARPHPPRRRPAAEAALPHGFEYSDCWVDDARLVVLNALDAAERGAAIRTRTRVTRAERERGLAARSSTRRAAARSRPRACWSTPRVRGSASSPRRCCACRAAAAAARQGQPHRGAASCSIMTAATSSRTPTAASCSRCRSRDDFTLIGTTDENFTGRSRCRGAERRRGDLSLRAR